MSEHEVADDERLWRRVHRDHYVTKNGTMVVSSAAFSDPSLSVDRARIVEASGGDAGVTMQDGVGVAEFTAALARGKGASQIVEGDPTPDNPAHAIVRGAKPKAVARFFANSSVFIPRTP